LRANQRWRLQMFVPEGARSAGSVQPFVGCAMRTIFYRGLCSANRSDFRYRSSKADMPPLSWCAWCRLRRRPWRRGLARIPRLSMHHHSHVHHHSVTVVKLCKAPLPVALVDHGACMSHEIRITNHQSRITVAEQLVVSEPDAKFRTPSPASPPAPPAACSKRRAQ